MILINWFSNPNMGDRIEIAAPYTQGGQHIAGAMVIAEEKSGEKLLFSGDPAFVGAACNIVPWFNSGGENALPLTDPQQRVMAGYDKPETHPYRPVMTHVLWMKKRIWPPVRGPVLMMIVKLMS
ncbi:hypothetical protein AB9P72_004353 [Salmonella enterica]